MVHEVRTPDLTDLWLVRVHYQEKSLVLARASPGSQEKIYAGDKDCAKFSGLSRRGY